MKQCHAYLSVSDCLSERMYVKMSSIEPASEWPLIAMHPFPFHLVWFLSPPNPHYSLYLPVALSCWFSLREICENAVFFLWGHMQTLEGGAGSAGGHCMGPPWALTDTCHCELFPFASLYTASEKVWASFRPLTLMLKNIQSGASVFRVLTKPRCLTSPHCGFSLGSSAAVSLIPENKLARWAEGQYLPHLSSSTQ